MSRQRKIYVSEQEKPFNTTARVLHDACIADRIPDCKQVLDDFGFLNNDQHLLLAIYQNILIYQGITANMLHNIQIAGRLNEFIQSRYLDNEGTYYTAEGHEGICTFYQRFLKSKISITIPKSGVDYNFTIPIYDTCTECGSQELHKNISNNRFSRCGICQRVVCDKCYTPWNLCSPCYKKCESSVQKLI